MPPLKHPFTQGLQLFIEQGLNNSWELGLEVLTGLHGVLNRFHDDYISGQRVVSKIFYQVRISKEEQYMQLFLWSFTAYEQVRTLFSSGHKTAVFRY